MQKVLAGAPMFPKIPSCLPISWIFVGISLWYRAIEALEAMQSASTRRCLRWFSNAWERPNLEKEWSTLYLQIPFGMPNSTLNFNSYVDMDVIFRFTSWKMPLPRSFNKRYCLSSHLMPKFWRGKGACFLQDASPIFPENWGVWTSQWSDRSDPPSLKISTLLRIVSSI